MFLQFHENIICLEKRKQAFNYEKYWNTERNDNFSFLFVAREYAIPLYLPDFFQNINQQFYMGIVLMQKGF